MDGGKRSEGRPQSFVNNAGKAQRTSVGGEDAARLPCCSPGRRHNGTGVRAGLLRVLSEESACQRPGKRAPDHHSHAKVLVVVGPYVLKIAKRGALGHRDRRRHGAVPDGPHAARRYGPLKKRLDLGTRQGNPLDLTGRYVACNSPAARTDTDARNDL